MPLSDPQVAALARQAVELLGPGENIGETERFWGRAFPPCPAGHAHPADVVLQDDAVLLRCPTSAATADRIEPAV